MTGRRPDAMAILESAFPAGSPARGIMIRHAEQVAEKAVSVARGLAGSADLDLDFIREAAILHDIGVSRVGWPRPGINGSRLPYLCHGVLGRRMLDAMGLPRHGLVCERHVGVGLTAADVAAAGLPLPRRDMRPVSLEEQIVAYADKFYSKSPLPRGREKEMPEILAGLERFGREKAAVFREWAERFEGKRIQDSPPYRVSAP